jgi:hypothetical protein
MKPILTLILSILCLNINSQTWSTLLKSEVYQCTPTNQFIIDPFRNDIWLISDSKTSVIKSSGQVFQFGETELGLLWTGDNLSFGFSQEHIYFSKLLEGLYSFDNFTRLLEFNSPQINKIATNEDTVYTLSGTQNMYKYTPSSTIDAMYGLSNVVAKNEFLYFNSGVIGRKIGTNSVYLHTDPQYIISPINDFKFSRKSDTLYVAHHKGVNFAYNYDFIDTITPNNSTNMPSPNVLEIEFDHNDSLWAVFGDNNDVPFAIAKLEGYTWTNHIDANNSPIDFTAFYGLEIDTLGNLWVADYDALHTLLTPNSPEWLNTPEISDIIQLEVFPNPFNDVLTIRSVSKSIKSIEMTDVNGRIIYQKSLNSISFDIQTAQWKEGIYFLKCQFEDGTEHLMKVTK